jgi:hypothetical protein
MKAYNAADYRTAIKEFSSAQQLAPADLMNYNLALCYDKLGEAEPAIQYYKEYLAKVPNAGNRTEIEASVSRLEGALKSAAQKRADEQRAADEARKADEAAARKAAEDAARKKPPEPTNTGAGTTGAGTTGAGTAVVAPDPGPTQPTGVGSTGTPGSGQAVSTGDAQLDRASAISIDEIRAQRMGMGTTTGMGAGGAAMGTQGMGGAGGQGMGAQGNAGGAGARGQTPGAPPEVAQQPDQPKKPTPVYKKWWFWVVVAISAVVVFQIVTEGSNSNTPTRAREAQAPGSPRAAAAASEGGFTLLRF